MTSRCSRPETRRALSSGGLVGPLSPPAQQGEVLLVHRGTEPCAPLALVPLGGVKQRHPLPVRRKLGGQIGERALVFHVLSRLRPLQSRHSNSFSQPRRD